MSNNTQPATQPATQSDDYNPFAPLPDVPVQEKPKRKRKTKHTPKYKRRSKAEMAQDAAAAAARVKSQVLVPDTPAMRHDKPHRAMSVAYSPMAMPPAQDVPQHVLSIAQGAGVDIELGDTLEDVFSGVVGLSPFACPRAVMFLFSLASGARHKEAFLASGLTNIDVNLFCRVDDAFSKSYDFAKRLQSDAMSIKVVDAAVERAVDGVLEPIVGRTGKNQDGHLVDRAGDPMYKVRHSDKLAEVLLRATDKRFRDDSGGAGAGAGTTYNIQINHAPPPDAPTVVDMGGKAAENDEGLPATLDFSDIDDD